MLAATTAVKGGCHIKRAALEHCVPVSTLCDRISGRVVHGTPAIEISSSCSKSAAIHRKEGPSCVSKYLQLPQVTPTSKALPRARLLTSADAMAQIEEKERKRKLALEEKERRKVEREEKRQQKEIEQKRKAEEQLEKARTRAEKINQVAKKKRTRVVTEKTAPAETNCRSQESTGEPPRKKPRKEQHNLSADAEIDTNVCCVCFGLYSEDISGADWIECGCGRWLHEECAEECVVDANGKERFCPTCL